MDLTNQNSLSFDRDSSAGFTIIELIVVISIFSIMATVGLFLSMDFFKTYSTNSEIITLVSVLSKARALSLDNINGNAYGVHFTGSEYAIFEGPTGVTWNTRITSEDQNIPVGTSVTASGPDIVFAQLSGQTSCVSLCAITLSGQGQVKTVNINSLGAILW